MSVLILGVNDLKRLFGLSALDTSQDAAITVLLTAEQPAQEYALDPGMLAAAVAATVAPPALDNPGLNATLTLGMAETLAGSYLTDLGRFPHYAEPIPLSGLVAQATAELTVATSDIKRLLAIEPSDTSQDTDIGLIITAEQLALEYALDPATLAAAVSTGTPNAGLKAWLTLGVAEQIAGHYLEQTGRVPGLAVDVQISSLHFTTSHAPQPGKLGSDLATQGLARLLPFLRLPRAERAVLPFLNQADLWKHGQTLAAQGLARLAPYSRAKKSLNIAAGGLTPDDYAPIPQLLAGGILPGAVLPAAPSVFTEVFTDVGNSDSDLCRAEGEGMIFWGGPE